LKLHLDKAPGEYRISAYTPDAIVVNDEPQNDSVIVSATAPPIWWPPNSVEEIDAAAIALLLEYDPEVVLIGTGARQIFPDMQLFSALYERGIGVEVMDTKAACRTFNIVAAEARRVVAGLIPLHA
jgi:uncharacterized protein